MSGDERLNARMLDLAARAALRGAGRVEPNPMVGCVIGDDGGAVWGVGHHRVFGGAHAEVEALASCRANGRDPHGGTAWVTLEPCAHHGKTPPCAEALIAAGIRRVVIARRDPNEVSMGGVEVLRSAGVRVEESNANPAAVALSEPFVRMVRDKRPFVTLKWAQSIDGRIATRTGESKWISCEKSRRRVHRMRACADVILTGAGTVLADDPLLTARGVPVRRVASRVVIDSRLRTPVDSAMVRTADETPLWIVTNEEMLETERADELAERGARMLFVPPVEGKVDLAEALGFFAELSELHACDCCEDHTHEVDATHVLVEAGPGLMGALMDAGLVDRCVVFQAPIVIGDDGAPGPARLGERASLALATRFDLIDLRRCGDDAMLTYARLRDTAG